MTELEIMQLQSDLKSANKRLTMSESNNEELRLEVTRLLQRLNNILEIVNDVAGVPDNPTFSLNEIDDVETGWLNKISELAYVEVSFND